MGSLLSVCCGDGQESTKAGLLSSSEETQKLINDNIANTTSPHSSSPGNNSSNMKSNSISNLHTNHLSNNISPYNTNNTNNNNNTHPSQTTTTDHPTNDIATAQENEKARHEAMLQEQARLENIVSTAGRTMLAVRRRDGYYDPEYAAAQFAKLSQNQAQLQQPPPQIQQQQQQIKYSQQQSKKSKPWGKTKDIPTNTYTNSNIINPTNPKTMQGQIPKSTISNDDDAQTIMDLLSSPTMITTTISSTENTTTTQNNQEIMNLFLEDCTEAFLKNVCPTKERLFHGLESVIENLP